MRAIQILLAVLFSIALASCGGGGGGGGSTSTPATHNISGTVAGAANVTINLTGAASKTTTTDASGNYSFSGLANGSYTVTPSLPGHVFTPTSTAVIMNGPNVTGQNLIATSNNTPTYCLSGMVSGVVMQNVTVTLSGANTGSTVTDASGNYSFCGLVNGSYTVTPFLAGYSFTTPSIITISSANPPSNNFTSAVVPSGGKVVFVPLNPLPPATVGAAYSNTVISAPTSGGTSPYHYQSDSFITGAPPIGMIVDLSGNLTGTPSVAGTYTFGVCAVDLVGASSCGTTSIKVNPALVVSLAGIGSGTVTSSPAGISCGATCSAGFASGTSVTLTATPAVGSTFTGWSGACSGTGSCVVTMNANQTVTANFDSATVLTGTWSGTWAWSGTGSNGCTNFIDGGAFSMALTQTGTSFTGSISAAGIQTRDNSTCALMSTGTGSGAVSGTISGTTLNLSFNPNGGIATLNFTATATLDVNANPNTLTANFVRDTGGSGTFTLTRQ
jgi:hypothetical protein